MDELDVKIVRALISESAIAPTSVQVKSSLRAIARRLGADDMTVINRFRKLQQAGCMSEWHLAVNPTFLGYGMTDLLVDAETEFVKPDSIRKLGLVHGVVVIINFLGRGLKVIFLHDSERARERTVELISRIANAERVVASRVALPLSETKKLTETDLAVIAALSSDARRPCTAVAEELGLSSRTVKNRIQRLRREKTLFTLPNLNMTNIVGFNPAVLSYAYSRGDVKANVDRAFISHFDPNLLWGGFADPEHAFLVLSAPAMADVVAFADWAKSQDGVASARVDIPVHMSGFPQKFGELLLARENIQAARRSR